MAKLCRTCLGEIRDTTYIMLNTKGVKANGVQAQLSACLPELQLNLVKDPVVCRNCMSILELAYTFKIRCLLTEERIQSCIRRTDLNGKRVTLAELFSFAMQPNRETSCTVINSSERSDLGAVGNDNSEQFFGESEIPSLGVQSDNVEKERTKDHIFSTAKQDSNFIVNHNVSKVATEEANELGNVVTNGQTMVNSTTHNLECRENVSRSSSVVISTINRYEICRGLQECEILTVKSEADEILNLKKENINDDEKGITVTLSEVSNIIDVDITEEIPNITHDTDTSDLFDGDDKFPLSTTEDDIIEENYSSCSFDSYFDTTSIVDFSANTSINDHKVASVNLEEEKTNNCGTSSPRKVNNAYNVNRGSEEMNNTDNDSIIKEEHMLAPFKIENEELLHEKKLKNCTVNVDVRIKECFVNLERLPVPLSVLMNKSSFSVNELLNLRETNKTVGRNLFKNNRAHTDEKSFRCKICDFITTTKLSYLKHNQTHKGKKGYCCNVCDYSTAYRHHLIDHMPKHTGNKPFRCTTCDYKTVRKQDLVAHSRIHSGNTPFRCATCDYKTTKKRYLVEHIAKHTGNKPFRCTTCDYKTVRKQCLVDHLRIHTGEKPFCCATCDYRAPRKRDLVLHSRIHTGEEAFRCTACNYKTFTKRDLVKHSLIHTDEKLFCCFTCDYKTTRKGYLVEHMLKHTGNKRFRCTSCDFKTVRKRCLVDHLRIHTGEKPFCCVTCDYKAPRKQDLVKHLRIHSDEKLFICSVCGFSVKMKESLIVHMQTHTKEKPFRCSTCEYSAATQAALNMHLTSHADEKSFCCDRCGHRSKTKQCLVAHMETHR